MEDFIAGLINPLIDSVALKPVTRGQHWQLMG